MPAMATLGFLHTADVHVATFRSLVEATGAEVTVIEHVDAELLARASAGSPDDVADDVASALAGLIAAGADHVVCTCSTLGGLAETLGDGTVSRVDRPMVAGAVASGRPLTVVVAVDATIEPTLALVADEAGRQGVEPVVELLRVPDAWERFLDGDSEGYVSILVETIEAEVDPSHLVILAQGSMGPVADRLTGIDAVSSPSTAVAAAVEALTTPAD